MTDEKPVLSGFCSTPPGITCHTRAHAECHRRLDDGRLTRCDCPDHHDQKGAS